MIRDNESCWLKVGSLAILALVLWAGWACAQSPAGIYYVHTDHLNTPRAITNNAGQIVWTWENIDPFGSNAPDENPTGLGTFTCNMRLPGQYFDRETKLHYNYFRDYDPSVGRYVESDPIGLRGGINTYAYVGNNPSTKSDRLGLDETIWMPGPGRHIKDGPRNGNWCGGNWSGGQVPSLNGGRDGPRGAVDSLDRCCMFHDRCYTRCDRYPEKTVHEACLIECDRGLVSCLRSLSSDCMNWPNPPRAGTEGESQWYREDALNYFIIRIQRWEAANGRR